MAQTALILEGGGMRGMYTAGVLDYLLDQEIHFARIYGVSAGACHACSYLSRQRGRARRTVVDFMDDPRYAGFRSFLRTGDFFGVQMIYHDIPNRLLPYDYEAYQSRRGELYAVATNCRTGEAEYLPVEDMHAQIDRVQASSSLPLLSRMVEIDGELYLDGGVSDSIPIARAIADGFQRQVLVLTRHRGYRKKPAGMRGLARLRYRRYPRLVESMERRHLVYNASLDLAREREAAGQALILQPQAPVAIGRLERDRAKLDDLYRLGYDDARAMGETLRRFLEPGESQEQAK